MTQHHVTDAEFAAAMAAGRTDAEAAIRAQAARYVADRDAIDAIEVVIIAMLGS